MLIGLKKGVTVSMRTQHLMFLKDYIFVLIYINSVFVSILTFMTFIVCLSLYLQTFVLMNQGLKMIMNKIMNSCSFMTW